MSGFILNIETPLVTAQKYADMVGLPVNSVKSKIKLGHLPTVKQGKSRLINVALITKNCLESEI